MTVPAHILDRGVIATGRINLSKASPQVTMVDYREVRQLSTGRIECLATDGQWMQLAPPMTQHIEWATEPTDDELLASADPSAIQSLAGTHRMSAAELMRSLGYTASSPNPRSDRWMLTYASKDGSENETIPLDSSTAFRMLCESMQYESKMSDFLRVTEQMRATGKMFSGVNYNFWIKREGE